MQTLLKGLSRVEGVLAVTAYAITVAVLLADVVSREIFARAIWGAEKTAVLSAIVAGILGMSIAVSNNAHLRATFADGLLPQPWVGRLGDALSAALFAWFAIYAVDFVRESYTFADKAETLQIPLWPVQLVFPVALASCALKHLIFAVSPALKPASDAPA